MTTEPIRRKLRILCLHGFRTNANIMDTQILCSLFSSEEISSFVDFFSLDGPIKTEDDSTVPQLVRQAFGQQDPEVGYREWYNRSPENEYVGLDEALRVVNNAASGKQINQIGPGSSKTCRLFHNGERNKSTQDNLPFDGILGFSQGGSLSLYALAEQCRRKEAEVQISSDSSDSNSNSSDFKFGVLISCYAPRDVTALEKKLYPLTSEGDVDPGFKKYDIPVLCIAQQDDTVVPTLATQKASEFFEESEFILNARGGHKIPNSKETQESESVRIIEFFKKQAIKLGIL